MRTCAHCGINIEGKRANARYCSTSCRVMGNRRPPLPQAMTRQDRWVLWKPFKRRGTWSKLPIQLDGAPASSTDPGTWVAFAQVRGELRKGFVLGGGIGCIDLDECITDGVIAPWAQKVIAEHVASAVWIEVSPSGNGVHIFTPMGPGSGRVIRDGERKIEIYPPDSGRFICVTGVPLKY